MMFRIALWMAAVLAGMAAARAQAVTAEQLAGRWGLASYFQERDYAKARAAARAACGAPFTIGRGPAGTVMMYGPDNPSLQPFVLRASGGRIILSAAQSPGRADDRELRTPEPGVVTLTFIDPSYASRYGTEVLVRCGRK